MSKERCPRCESSTLIKNYQTGTTACKHCGLVTKLTTFDRGPTWTRDGKRKRCGTPPTYTIHDKDLATTIDFKNKDAKGNSFSSDQKSRAYRLRKWQKRSRFSRTADRGLATALSNVHRVASLLGVPYYIKEEVSLMYRDAMRKDLIRGRTTESVVAAIFYIVCRKFKMPRSFDEIAEETQVEKKQIVKCYLCLRKKLEIFLPLVDSLDYVNRFCSELGVSNAVKTKTIELLETVKKRKLTPGKNPIITVAAVLYIATVMMEEKKSQREIAQVAHASEVGIRNRFKELIEKADLDVEIGRK